MEVNILRLGQVVLLTVLLSGCTGISSPAKDSGLARFKLTEISSASGCMGCRTSYQDRAIIV